MRISLSIYSIESLNSKGLRNYKKRLTEFKLYCDMENQQLVQELKSIGIQLTYRDNYPFPISLSFPEKITSSSKEFYEEHRKMIILIRREEWEEMD